MYNRTLIVFLIFACLACTPKREKHSENEQKEPVIEIEFEKSKWKLKQGKDYPYRDSMLHYVVYNDSIRALNKAEIVTLLGDPDRINENYLYHTIAQKRIGSWPLHTKTLVIKFKRDDSIEWIKIHE